MSAFSNFAIRSRLWSYWPVHARGVRARTHGTELTVWEGCHKTNMVLKMAVRFLQLWSLVVELLARARKGRACAHARNGANSLGGMSQDY